MREENRQTHLIECKLSDSVTHRAQEPRARFPRLALPDRAIRRNVPVQILSGREARCELAAEHGLSNLPRTGEHGRFALQIRRNEIIEIAFHGDQNAQYCTKVATFLQFKGIWPNSLVQRVPQSSGRFLGKMA